MALEDIPYGGSSNKFPEFGQDENFFSLARICEDVRIRSPSTIPDYVCRAKNLTVGKRRNKESTHIIEVI